MKRILYFRDFLKLQYLVQNLPEMIYKSARIFQQFRARSFDTAVPKQDYDIMLFLPFIYKEKHF